MRHAIPNMKLLAVLTILVGISSARSAEVKEHPIAKDKTGIRWVYPFKDALARAEKEGKLLVIKPVAFGTQPDGCL